MPSDELDLIHSVRRNHWPSTLISPFEYPSQPSGNGFVEANLGLDKISTENESRGGEHPIASSTDSLDFRTLSAEVHPSHRLANGRPRPIHENFYSLPYTPHSPKLPAWATSGVRLPSQYFLPSSFEAPNGLLSIASIDENFDGQNLVEGIQNFSSLEADLNSYANEFSQLDNSFVDNLKRPPRVSDQEPLTLDTSFSRPLSDSAFSLSSQTASIDFSDLSAYSSEVPLYTPDYTPRSSLNLSSIPLSPVPSPRRPHSEVVRGGNRSRASPSPRSSMRGAPYPFDGVRKRWSTGSYASRSGHSTSPFLAQKHASLSRLPSPSMRQSRILPSTSHNRQQVSNRNSVQFQQDSLLMHANFTNNTRFQNPAPLASQGIFRTLQSDTDPHHHYFDSYSEFPSPPDLLGPLKEEPIPPPPEDMMPQDPNMVPHEQDLRFENDLYTPRWVRGHGNKREGWCGICKPGRWLVLKNSAFWYDKSFTHGISAATGQPFAPPKETRRTEGNTNVWEGLCGNCDDWVALVSSKKKGTTWFRHAYKCHNSHKNGDTLKRRRDNSPGQGRPSTSESRPRSSSVKGESMSAPVPTATRNDLISPRTILDASKTISPLHTIATMI
ncbi:hypothetical protein AJ80_03577 [Polytolypa hystricis UAMH7299]|uniref:Transcription regulator Rua1 C-terminal domain-containing protein n=1 Tax=Polytolypa hystricis (strain UAMH7299) TaxID=1447883 RepID=A0A2B7YHC6_POLH7|nr:hypothetical protein AJ80_03577 [Polytolypa hystricis UAMH7299]